METVSPAVVNELQAECDEIKDIKVGKCPLSLQFQEVKFGKHNLLCETSRAQPLTCLPVSLTNFVLQQLHGDHKGEKGLNSRYY